MSKENETRKPEGLGMKEVIKHAAVKAENGMIFLGRSHADCFYQMRNVGMMSSDNSKDQGFFTSKGRYVDRLEAAKIAKRTKQVTNSKDRPLRRLTSLLSEDIWYQTHRYIYTPMTGYVEIVQNVKPKRKARGGENE